MCDPVSGALAATSMAGNYMASRAADDQAEAQYLANKAYVNAQRERNQAFFDVTKERVSENLLDAVGQIQIRAQQEEALFARSLIEQNDEANAATAAYAATAGESGVDSGGAVFQEYYALKARQVAYATEAQKRVRINSTLALEQARDQAESTILSAFPPVLMDPIRPQPQTNLLSIFNAGVGGYTSGITINDALGR